MFHRRAVIVAALAAVMLVAAVTAAVSARSPQADPGARRPSAQPANQVPGGGRGSPGKAPVGTKPYTPSLVEPPDTPVQRQVDAELSKAESPASIAAAEAIDVPAPAVSKNFPAVPGPDRVDATAYAGAFATELLDIDYATDTRDELLAWAESEEAANTLPGVPASVANKALYGSLAYPDLPGGTPSPTPSAAGWATDATAGLAQRVSNLQVSESPEWTSVIVTGWQPRDELMSIEVITGTLTTTGPGRPPAAASFSLTLTVGSAAHHPGLGAVAAGQWQEG
jgi:hypothetical protein